MGYTMDPDPERTAKAYGSELQMSPKESVEVCDMLKGKDVDEALDILDRVIDEEKAVPYKRHKKKAAHQKGIGSGGYPKKVCRKMKTKIEECRSNAEDKGLDIDNLKIKVLAAHKGSPIEGRRPRAMGRSTPHDTKTTNLEIILEEKEA